MEKPDKTTRRIRGTTAPVELTAHAMRRELTPAEQALWQALKGRKLGGLKFRRQHPVGNFILDFYCPTHHLVIELDGGVHDAQVEHDAARTAHLNAYGYRVIRFRNEDVMSDLPSVLRRILEAAKPSPRPSATTCPEGTRPTLGEAGARHKRAGGVRADE